MRRATCLVLILSGCGGGSGNNNQDDLSAGGQDFATSEMDLSVSDDLSTTGNPDLAMTGGNPDLATPDDASTPGISWSARRFGGDQWSLAYGGGKFVAACTSAMVESSTDGITWTPTLVPGGSDLSAITYGNGLFVAVDSGDHVLSSPDGTTWTQGALASAFAANALAYNGINWTVVGDKINTSADLVSWSDTTPAALGNPLRAVAALGTTFIAVGDSGQTALSTDGGVTWTLGTTGDTSAYYSLSCVTTPAKLCVAVGAAGALLSTADGITWTAHPSNVADDLHAVVRFNLATPIWVAVGLNGAVTGATNVTTWTAHTSGVTAGLLGVAASGTLLATVGNAATRLTSANGTTFVNRTGPSNPLTLATDGTTLIAAGGTELVRSTDGNTFTALTPLAAPVTHVGHAGSFFFATGDGPALFASPDGVGGGAVWTRHIAADASGNTVAGVAHSATLYVAVGGNANTGTPASWTSANGTTWTLATITGITSTVVFSSIAYGAGLFAATQNATGSTIYTSTDGKAWTDRLMPVTASSLEAVVFAGGKFVAVGSNELFTSADGITWTVHTDPKGAHDYALTFGASQYLAVGDTGGATGPAEIITSPDGVTWTNDSNVVTENLWGATWFGGLYYASGDGELIIAGK